jgi:hypothetical protein
MGQRFTASDFSDARYNVMELGDSTVLKRWPELTRLPEFRVNLSKTRRLTTDKMHRFALLMYTPNILHKAIPEIAKRKAEAALLAGFPYREGSRVFRNNVEEMLLCLYEDCNDLFIRAVRLARNSQFEQLVVYEEARARQMRKLIDDIDGNEKTKELHDNIRRLSDDIERLQTEILYQDNEKPLIDRLYFAVENVQLGIRPEEIAELRKGAKLGVLLNPKEIPYLEERLNVRDEPEGSEGEI